MSVECRDWLTTLWPASYKGAPFYFDSDKEEGGRGLVIHKLVNRDDPFNEDLGEEPRFYSGSAYVHGDDVDAKAGSLISALTSRGAGILVVPLFGPVLVRLQTFERVHEKDKLGYCAFEVKFVREGAPSAFVSVPLLQNIAFGKADVMQTALATWFPQAITALAEPDYVVAQVTDTVASAASTLDVIRQTYPTDPKASATLRDTIVALLASIPNAVSNATDPGAPALTLADNIIATTRALGDALPATSAARGMLEMVDAFAAPPAGGTVIIAGKPYVSPTMQRAASNQAAAYRLARLAAMTAYAEAVLRSTFVSRPDGVTARGEVAERFENELYDTSGAANAPLYLALEQLQGTVIEWLTKTINNLAPVITVESARIRPSLDLAWALYADPLRADELVARNKVRHPSFMPRVIQALSR